MQGTLFLIVGPSGAGKDTLIAAARAVLDARFSFPTRVITRAAETDGEAHESVDLAAFEAHERRGDFALSWRAHGLAYGIPVSIVADLHAGKHVVANVSRTVAAGAKARFAQVRVILINASADVRRARLKARGREGDDAVEARVARAAEVAADRMIVNDGAPEVAVQAFLQALKG